MKDVLAVILAGGKGSRLEPLTRDRAKPAVPFGGAYRIIDFTLSNCLNSGVRKNLVLTQYKAMSLDRHINLGWQSYLCRELGEFIDVVPPQQRIDEHWYQGTADAVYQNIYTIEKERPKYVVILAGDHIYKMNYATLVERHKEANADVTIATLRVAVEAAAQQFGVLEIGEDNRVVGFQEKPPQPKSIPGDPGHTLASMGVYVFTARFLFEQLCLDATRHGSQHDFGRNLIPAVIHTHRVFAYPFIDENRKQEAYWRDVGTLDAYYDANMDLISVDPQLNMYDARLAHPHLPAEPAAAEVRVRRARPVGAARPGARQHHLPRVHRLRRPVAAVDRRARLAHQQLRPGGRLDPLRGRRRGAVRQDPPRDHRQGRPHSRRLRDRLRPRSGPQPRLHGHGAGRDRDRQDARHGAFLGEVRRRRHLLPRSASQEIPLGRMPLRSDAMAVCR